MLGAKITLQILDRLYRPAPKTRKGENGRLLIIAGSKKYHGSLILCAGMAAKIVDLVYVHTTKDNFRLIKNLRQKLAEFIYIDEKNLGHTAKEADAILIGPGLIPNKASAKLVNNLLIKYPKKKFLLDAAAIRVLNLKNLNLNCVLTPHAGEFKDLFKLPATPLNLAKIAKKYPSVFTLKGPTDYVAENGQIFFNQTGNQGMTKGGTGDVLSGLTAALLTKNSPLLAAQAGIFLNGLAGDRAKKKFGFYFSASELIPEAQKLLAGSRDKLTF